MANTNNLNVEVKYTGQRVIWFVYRSLEDATVGISERGAAALSNGDELKITDNIFSPTQGPNKGKDFVWCIKGHDSFLFPLNEIKHKIDTAELYITRSLVVDVPSRNSNLVPWLIGGVLVIGAICLSKNKK